jgi:hypothetical protein
VMTPPRPAADPAPEHDVTRIEFTTADLPAEPPAQDPGPANDNAVAQSQQQQQRKDLAPLPPRELGASVRARPTGDGHRIDAAGGAGC